MTGVSYAQVLLQENLSYTGYSDVSDGGQSFTLIKPISITEIQLKAEAVNGGSDFTVYITEYDPWNHVHGENLGQKRIDRETVESLMGDAWISIAFDTAIAMGEGIYAINIDTHTEETPGSYNKYAMGSADVFSGGRRILAPSEYNWYTNHHDLAFRIFGFGDTDAMTPQAPVIPEVRALGTSTRSWSQALFLDFEYPTENGVVYARSISLDLSEWGSFSGYTLGNGSVFSSSSGVSNTDRLFVKIVPFLLGDTVGRKY